MTEARIHEIYDDFWFTTLLGPGSKLPGIQYLEKLGHLVSVIVNYYRDFCKIVATYLSFISAVSFPLSVLKISGVFLSAKGVHI